MSVNPAIHIFTKSNCNYCTRAKSVLSQEGLDYIEHDVEQIDGMAAASTYYSGSVTLPQIFIGSQHVNGAEDLESLQRRGLIKSLLDKAEGELVLDPKFEQQWTEGSEDFTLAHALDKVDISSAIDDPEYLLISHFYKGMFGFTPISYLYLGIWPTAFKACALYNVIPTFPALAMQLGQELTFGLTYAASSAQGCDYCTAHTVATTGVEQAEGIQELISARAGNPRPDSPFDELDLALVELVEQATLNKVTNEQITRIHSLAQDASKDPQYLIKTAALGGVIMGLLNIFNDLVNVAVESSIASIAEDQLGLGSGRHSVEESPDDLNFELPETELTIETALSARREEASDWQAIAEQKLGHVPVWLSQWPEHMVPFFASIYTDLLADSEISSELKHLMARTSAIAKGHAALAASAAVSAHHVASNKAQTLERIKHCFTAATDESESDLFSAAEKAALRLAWLSAQTPIMTSKQFMQPLVESFSQRQIVELCVACGIACSAQRMAAALQVELGGEEKSFCAEHGIETDVLLLKYPIVSI